MALRDIYFPAILLRDPVEAVKVCNHYIYCQTLNLKVGNLSTQLPIRWRDLISGSYMFIFCSVHLLFYFVLVGVTQVPCLTVHGHDQVRGLWKVQYTHIFVDDVRIFKTQLLNFLLV